MLSRVEEFHGPTPASLRGFLAIRIWMVALIFSVVWGSDLDASAKTSVARQQIGVEQRLEAEKRLWELGYWAGPIDGTFDSASRHALVAFQKVEGRTRSGNLTLASLFVVRFGFLVKVVSDIQDILARPEGHTEHYRGLNERLKDAVAQLEASHPEATLLMRQVIDQLAYMGI